MHRDMVALITTFASPYTKLKLLLVSKEVNKLVRDNIRRNLDIEYILVNNLFLESKYIEWHKYDIKTLYDILFKIIPLRCKPLIRLLLYKSYLHASFRKEYMYITIFHTYIKCMENKINTKISHHNTIIHFHISDFQLALIFKNYKCASYIMINLMIRNNGINSCLLAELYIKNTYFLNINIVITQINDMMRKCVYNFRINKEFRSKKRISNYVKLRRSLCN